jgi:hypothetical protein
MRIDTRATSGVSRIGGVAKNSASRRANFRLPLHFDDDNIPEWQLIPRNSGLFPPGNPRP